MTASFEVESTLTDRYQTTVPEIVRRALKLGKRDKIHYTISPSGEVVLTRVEASDSDIQCSVSSSPFWMLTSHVIPSGCHLWMPGSSNGSNRW